jgi:hypothetical protein
MQIMGAVTDDELKHSNNYEGHWKLAGTFLWHSLTSTSMAMGMTRLRPSALALMAVQRQSAASRSATPCSSGQHFSLGLAPTTACTSPLSASTHASSFSVLSGHLPVGDGDGVYGGAGFGVDGGGGQGTSVGFGGGGGFGQYGQAAAGASCATRTATMRSREGAMRLFLAAAMVDGLRKELISLDVVRGKQAIECLVI